jgi:hypothetical protein
MKFSICYFKLAKITTVLWLLLIPTQLGRHWWPEWSLVRGVRVDYLSPTLYLIDLLWGLWLIFNFKFLKFSRKSWWLIGFLAISMLAAENKWAAIYKTGRLVQLAVTVILIKNSGLKIQNYLRWIVPTWIIVESLLGTAQVINGGSLGGVWYWLGERRFDFNTIGIAQWSRGEIGLVRAYGTFSHPNSLAGFLVVCLVLGNRLFRPRKGISYWLVAGIGVWGILVTGSRVVWGLGLGYMIYGVRFMDKKIKVILVGLMIILIWRSGLRGWDAAGGQKRINLAKTAITMIKDNTVFGVGLNNFLVKSGSLQPVHNIFLLAGSELGILGVWGIWEILRRLKRANGWIWAVVVITGMVDHYWVTLAQNMWLVTLVLSLQLETNVGKINS